MNEHAWSLQCPAPQESGDRVQLAHGEGGRMTRRLIQSRVVPRFANPLLQSLGDSTLLPEIAGPLAFTTDSFVVTPLFFPGGDIGKLAVYGTVNDLVVAGATPLWLSLSLIVEEGLPMSLLERVLDSIQSAAAAEGVSIVTGDTKVVPRGAADKLFINTSGLGQLQSPAPAGPQSLVPGDVVLVSGPLAEHGLAVLAEREGFQLDPAPHSDCGSLAPVAAALRAAGIPVKSMRDATRGGLAAVLHEWSEASGHSIRVEESSLPVRPHVRGGCELLGIDPLFIANECVMVVGLPAECAPLAIEQLRLHADSPWAATVARVVERQAAAVTIQRTFGPELALDEPPGSPLPRIC